MHKRATWAVIGFVVVVVVAAALDSVFFRSHAPASTPGTTSEASGTRSEPSSDAPPCRSNQLKLRINRGGPQEPPRHDNYVTLNHIRGGACRFSGRLKRLLILARDGLAVGGVIQDDGGGFADAYGENLGRHIFRFRYSPKCNTPGPFIAQAQVGDYVASGKIRVFRCGVAPPPFQ
jgi:hypothetical protein